MKLIIYAILILIPLILILSPWFSKKERKPKELIGEGKIISKEFYLQQLVDLEYDFHMGKVSIHDYKMGKNDIMGRIVKLTSSNNSIKSDNLVDSWLAERGIRS
ncbi:hypothetical protein [Schinkia azotoformans]|nr:hypothetical protein [Schinkia azotoformans]MEC1742801.1 hypothetical protein [Schinkia azotoformans]MEC1769026.1 hypothetical protein [Schinkia azotoformans]MEC1789611.1 hypothetical protein [Schinkia azotoformans]MED4417421.1 hypothetical protein [Schinkia azotoformans]